MSAAITAAVIGAGVAYYSAQQTNKQSEQQSKIPTVQTSTPWEPSVQHRTDLMNMAMGLLGGGSGGGGAAGAAGGAGGGGYNLAAFEKAIMADPTMPAKGKEWILSFARRGEWNTVAANLPKMRLSDQTRASLGTLAGGSAPAARTGGGGGGGRGGSGGGGGGGTGVDYQGRIKEILDGKYLGGNPHLDAAVAAATRGMEDRYNQQYGANDLNLEAAGMFDSDLGAVGKARAFNDYNTAVGDVDAQMRFGDYNARMDDLMEALGIGTSYDANLKQVAASRYATSTAAKTAGAALAWDKQKFNEMAPFQKLGYVSDLVDQLSGRYGTVTTTGNKAADYTNPWGAAVKGGVGTYNMAQGW